MTKNISITIEEDVLDYIDNLASSESRTRSAMISYLLTWVKDNDKRFLLNNSSSKFINLRNDSKQ